MYDTIVIGLGGMGSATLFHLARAGSKALGLEQFGIPHSRGSSHGSTRIIRLAYSEGPEYIPLLRAAYAYWRDLERISGRSLLRITGGLDIGAATSWTVTGSRSSCSQHGLEFEELSAAEVNERFPGYRLPRGLRAIFQPEGGFLRSEAAIEAHVGEARKLGAEVLTKTAALSWQAGRSTVRVTTARGDFRARHVVLAAGAWTGSLVPALRHACVPERQVMLWTDPLEPGTFAPDRFPVFNMEAPSGRYYGFPDHAREGFKIGKYHHRRQPVASPDALDRECSPEDEAVLRQGIREHFPAASGPTRRMTACMFTNSPDGDFVLDRCPGERRVFVAAGFSGHGFKFCSVIGRIMAQYCTEGAPGWDTSRFQLADRRVQGWRGQAGPSQH